MEIWKWLAKIYDYLAKRRPLTVVLTSLISVGAIIADVSDFGGGLSGLFNNQGAMERRLEVLIAEVDADKAAAFAFEDGERRAIADVAQSGAMPVVNSNRIVSLSAPPFDELLAAHKKRQCWVYTYPKDGQNKNQLDDGMSRSGNRTIISCPIYSNQALKGTIGVGWGRYLSQQEIERKTIKIQEAANEIGEML
jgi:hypothetical protein